MAEYSNRLPFAADTGKGCIFISYAHRDREIVFPIITKLYEKGWPIWYDEGIEPGENWKAALNYRIGMSSLYLLFISKNSLRSVETIDHEFIVAHNFNKKIILCLIDDIDLQRDFPSLNYAAASYEDLRDMSRDSISLCSMRPESQCYATFRLLLCIGERIEKDD